MRRARCAYLMREHSECACDQPRTHCPRLAPAMAHLLSHPILLLLLTAVSVADAWRPPNFTLIDPSTNSHSPRIRRETPTIHHLHLLDWHLQLQENTAIRSPYYNDCQFYKGKILNEGQSIVTVTDCEGQLYGLLQVDNDEFVLQPTEQPEGAHILRRRDIVLSEQQASYNLTGDTVDGYDFDFNEEDISPMLHVHPRQTKYSDVEYFRNIVSISRPVSGVKGLWLEMAIVADKTMLKFHGRDRVKHYVLALMNIVSAIFNDPSLESNMTLVINKLFLYEDKDFVSKYDTVKKSLEAVNKWNYRHLNKLPDDTAGWDATVWLTRAQLGGPSGFAPVGGVCSRTKSAAINRDEGLTSAFVIAHELAHLLGLTHDGEEQCQDEARRGSVMAPTVVATLHNYHWSSCSKKQFHEKVKKWWCLHQRSQDDGVELGGVKELFNYVFSMKEQCRMEFGEGYSVCNSVKVQSTCSRLWCVHPSAPHICKSKKAPPLEGTPCGEKRWCVNRECEAMPGHENSVIEEEESIPEWTEWEEWSDCGTDCGYGLQFRSRRCRYKGSNLDEGCEGASTQIKTCWAGSPCSLLRDIRADICRRQGTHFIPYIQKEEARHCEIWCVNYEGDSPSNFGALPDGTACSYDKPYDLCYQGACVSGQCNVSDTACNWCPDGYCNNNTHLYHRQLGKGWARVAVIPHEARQISLHISTPIPIRVAIRERRREKHIVELQKHGKRFEVVQKQNEYFKYNRNVPQNLRIVEVDSNVIDVKEDIYAWEGAVVAAGTLVQWNQTDAGVHVTAVSPLQTDLMVMALPDQIEPLDDIVTVEVLVNYSTPAGRTRPLEYRWSTERGPCSASCGGGVRLVRQLCPQGHRCPALRYEKCNSHACEFVWVGGEWEACSATCGPHGVQERQLFCVLSIANTSTTRELIKHSVSPALCSSTTLAKEQACNRIHCPVYWQELPWTPCSTTCGRGFARRPLVCPAADEVYCGPKPRERRRRCRLRRCPSPRSAPCNEKDATQYCELFAKDDLKRNCVIPLFRKYCCNACRHSDLFRTKDKSVREK